MQLIIFGINLLLLMFVWNFIWVKTCKDKAIYDLEDLEDEARDFMLEQSYPLDDPAYIESVDLIRRLKFVVISLSMIDFICIARISSEHHDSSKDLFISNNKAVEGKCRKMAESAANIAMRSMILGSPLFVCIGLLLLPVAIVVVFCTKCKEFFCKSIDGIGQGFKRTVLTTLLSFLVIIFAQPQSQRYFARDTFDKYNILPSVIAMVDKEK